MAVDESLISTGVDNLLKLVYSKGRIKLLDAARELGIPAITLEEWARVLEEEGIVRLEYQLTTVFLVWTGTPKEESSGRKEEILEKSASLSEEIDAFLNKTRERGFDLQAAKAGADRAVAVVDQQSASLRQKIERMRLLEKESEKLFVKYAQSLEKIQDSFSAMTKGLEKTGLKIEELSSTLPKGSRDMDADLARLAELKKETDKIKDLKSELDGSVERLRKLLGDATATQTRFRAGFSSVSEDLADRESRLKRLDADRQAALSALRGAREEFETLAKSHSANSSALVSVVEKISSDFEKTKKEIDAAVEDAEESLKGISAGKKFEELSELQRQFSVLEQERKRLEEQAINLKGELESISTVVPERDIDKFILKTDDVKKRLVELKKEEEAFEKKRGELKELIRKMTGSND